MRSIVLASILAVSSVLSGCDSSIFEASTAQVVTEANLYATVEKSAHGFGVKNPLFDRTVYVFFDTQCSHCAHLWESFKTLDPKVNVVWIPVGMLRGASTSQGAALLAATDPIKAMNEHEELFAKNSSGMSAPSPTPEQKKVIKANTKLLMSLDVMSIPYLVAKHPVTGALIRNPGSLPPEQLKVLLGL
jgi:thiol:disulfide interchange protein DsbG